MSFDMFIKNIKNMPFNNQIFKQLHPFYFLATIFHLFLSLSLSQSLHRPTSILYSPINNITIVISLGFLSLSLFLSLSNNCSTQFHFTDLLFCLVNNKQKKKKPIYIFFHCEGFPFIPFSDSQKNSYSNSFHLQIQLFSGFFSFWALIYSSKEKKKRKKEGKKENLWVWMGLVLGVVLKSPPTLKILINMETTILQVLLSCFSVSSSAFFLLSWVFIRSGLAQINCLFGCLIIWVCFK